MRTQLRWSLIAVIALFVSLQGRDASAQATRSITGIVVDSEGGAPVTGVTVAVKDNDKLVTQTGADGAFVLAKVSTKEVVLQVSGGDYVAVEVPVKAGKTATIVTVTMVKMRVEPPPTRMVSGIVRDATTHAGLAAARIVVQGSDLATVTDEDGLFVLPGVATSDVVLEITAVDHKDGSVVVSAGDGVTKIDLEPTSPVVIDQPPEKTTRTIGGTVVELASGEPVIGATVLVSTTGQVGITDENGAFVIDEVPVGAVTLEITSAGYRDITVGVAAEATQVTVEMDFEQSEEILIVGRAPVIVKSNLANGASVVNDAELNKVSAQTVETAMTGKLAGANLQQNSGAPGGGTQLRLRGISTINGQSSPLYVIDGVIISNVAVASGANTITAAAAGGSASNQDNPVNRIADINPNDIASIEVLKGASAAALYGSKAANGVVIITTKRGAQGKTAVSVTQRFGFSQLSNKLGSRRFGSMAEVEEAYGAGSALAQAFADSGGQVFDHEAEITRSALATETIASASGGTATGNYYGSVLVKDEPGIVIGTYYQKQSGRLALGYNLWDKVKLGVTANLIHSVSDRGLTNNDNTGTSYYVVLSGTPSFVDLRPDNGVYPANPALGSGTNPMQTTLLFNNTEDVWRLIGGANASLEAYKEGASTVTLLGNFGADSFNQKNNILSPPELLFEEPLDGLAGTSIDATTTNLNYNLGTGALWTYRPTSGAFKSALSAGLTYESVDLSSVYVIAQDLTAGQPNIDSGSAVGVSQTRLRTKDQGLYLQEEVALMEDKLSLLAGLLAERSSLNGDTAKYYVFPKIAAVYSLEDYVPEDKFDTARVRAALGQAGNRPNFGQKFTALNATNNIEGNAGLVLGLNAGDPAIEPERQTEVELGVDAAGKDQRAVVELTVYQRSISNLLLQRSLATSTGFTTQFFNGGAMKNTGVEAAVQVTPVAGEIDWTTRAILTLNRSKVTDLPEGIEFFDITAAGFGTGLGAYRIEEGKSATQMVATIGDNDGDGVPEVAPVGDGEPDFRVGWANNVQWKRFSFGSLIDWQKGSKVVNLTRLLYDFGQVSPDFATDGAERLDAFINGDARPYIEDASFVKLREVSVAYEVPEEYATQIGPVETLQVSLSGRNLYTLTGYSGLDPEVSNFGNQPIGRNYDVAPYPPSRSFWFSITAGM